MNDRVAGVVIGRNEGARLERCLTTLAPQVSRLVYVDSGSRDGSVAFARGLGAEVIELDMSQPFTAARARNAGFEALKDAGLPEFVQFIDGDCSVEPDWVAKGVAALDQASEVAMVTGWRREIKPADSVYNAMCDHEWHRPAGRIEACGGDMLLRAEVHAALGGMNPSVIAAEDDELCVRLRKAGHQLLRIPEDMTVHDANMHRFTEWWRRAERTGHGFAQVGHLHPDYFLRERRRTWLWGLIVPVIALLACLLSCWLGVLLLLLYPFSWWRSAKGLEREGLLPETARHHAVFLTLSKFPNLLGMIRFHLRRRLGRDMRIIEYK